MKRRDYIKTMMLATGGLYLAPQWLVSCKSDAKTVDLIAGDIKWQPLSTFEEIRNASRLSKGHLRYEMQRLIDAKNAAAIYNFVNERLKTIPAFGNSIYYDYETVRWGENGLLRYGKGTLREKSDLLFNMLKKAGFSPSYHYDSIPITPKQLQQAYCSEKESHSFIEAPNSYIKKWEKTFGEEEITELNYPDEKMSQAAKELTQSIQAAMPQNAHDAIDDIDFFNQTSLYLPVVQFNDGETVKQLNVVEGKTYEQSNTSGSLFDLDIADVRKNISDVEVKVIATYANSKSKPLQLVAGKWQMEDIIGKQIALQFASTMPTTQLLQSTYEEVNQFVPFLTLVDPNMTNEQRKKHSFQGVGFDTFGNWFQKQEDGSVTVNDMTINTKLTAKASEVVSMKAVLIDDYQPNITMKIAPLNAKNELVLGLPNHAFVITDQGKQMPAVITQNSMYKKVLVMIDGSASMSNAFLATDIPAAIEEIKRAFTSKFGQVEVTERTFMSDFLKVLKKESVNTYDAVIAFGDGGEIETLTAEELIGVATNTILSYHFKKTAIGAESHKASKQIFEGAGHHFGFIDEFATDISAIMQDLEENYTHFPYVISYQSPISEKKEHQVRLSLNQNKNIPPQNFSYTKEEGKSYLQTNVPIGLTLELEWKKHSSSKKITRHLAGFNPKTENLSEDTDLSAFNAAVKDYIMGTHFIGFEGDQPTLPALVDQLYSGFLTQAPYFDDKATGKELIAALQNEQFTPVECLTTYTGIQDDVSENRVTFQDSFQAFLYSEIYDSAAQESKVSIDMLPTSNMVTFAKTKKEAFEKTLENSAYLALSEAQHFERSTISDLTGKALHLYQSEEKKHPLSEIFEWEKSYSYHLLHDESLASDSYWQINKKTGEILGMLPDGSGGGSWTKKQRMDMALMIWEKWTNLLVKVTKGGVAMGIVALYGMFLAELYALVALVVNDMGANTTFEEDLEKLLKKYAKKGFKKVKAGIKKGK